MKKSFQTIICATDLSDFSNIAITYGLGLARVFDAALHVCHVVDLTGTAIYRQGFYAPAAMEAQALQYAEEQLGALSERYKANWRTLLKTGHPADMLTRSALETGADLAVIAAHGRSGLKRLVIGSVTERLMRTLPCPMLVVRNLDPKVAATPERGVAFKRILVGCDFSPDSSLAFEYGLSLAQEFQSELHLVHVIRPSLYEDLLKTGSHPDETKNLRDQLKERLSAQVPQEAYHWCSPKISLMAGQPHEELTKYAVLHETDLIVLGIRGRSLVEALLVGSTTDRVVRQAPCPLLAVGSAAREGASLE